MPILKEKKAEHHLYKYPSQEIEKNSKGEKKEENNKDKSIN